MSSGPNLDPQFRAALRAELVMFVDGHPPHRRRWRLTAFLVAVVGLASGAGVATAALNNPPGSDVVNELTASTALSGSGSQDLSLGEAPEHATDVALEFRCDSPGEFGIAGNSFSCGTGDVPSSATMNVPLNLVPHGVITVKAPALTQWTIQTTYVDRQTAPWARNEDGLTFGAINSAGTPDLVAVKASNGRTGYAFAAELAIAHGDPDALRFTSPQDAIDWQVEARGTSVALPVYLSDGRTWVGEFIVQR